MNYRQQEERGLPHRYHLSHLQMFITTIVSLPKVHFFSHHFCLFSFVFSSRSLHDVVSESFEYKQLFCCIYYNSFRVNWLILLNPIWTRQRRKWFQHQIDLNRHLQECQQTWGTVSIRNNFRINWQIFTKTRYDGHDTRSHCKDKRLIKSRPSAIPAWRVLCFTEHCCRVCIYKIYGFL